MRQKTLTELENRTKRKLRFAEIHLEEITSRHELGPGGDFEIAHEESCLFHLIGAKDSFLQEIDVAYGLEVPMKRVNEDRLRRELKKRQLKSPALNEIMEREKDGGSWLAMAIEDRNQGMHRFYIPRNVEVVLGADSRISYTNPFTQLPMEIDILEFLRQCLENMEELLQRLRKTLPQEPAGGA